MMAPSMQKWAAHRNLWPTPNATDYKGANPLERRPVADDDLPTRVRRNWATPTKSDGTGGPGNSGRDGGENLRTQVGGSLNPTWVEWLLGFPLGWTNLTSDESPSASPSESTDCER